MVDARPQIPNPIQREIRQRCGFGCVICGCPLYEYHHMAHYRESKRHVASEITLLCDKHHKECTNLLLTDKQIVDANENPFNLQHGVSSPYDLHFEGDEFTCVIGKNRFTSSLRTKNQAVIIPISIDEIDLIYFIIESNGNIYLYVNIFDENNLSILTIIENRLAYRTNAWDIKFKGSTLTVREGDRKIFFEIKFEPPNQITISRARLLCNGVELLVRKSHIYVANSESLFVENYIQNCAYGIKIGRNQLGLGCGVKMDAARNYLPRIEVLRSERKSVAKMKEIMEEIREG